MVPFLRERRALDLHSSSNVLADLAAMDLESVCSTSIPSLTRITGGRGVGGFRECLLAHGVIYSN